MRFKSVLVYSIISLFALSACNKIIETDISPSGIPAVDGVNVFDTIINIVATNEGASLDNYTRLTDGDQLPLGIVNDPNFGKIQSNVYLQLKPQVQNATYPFLENKDSILGVDSVVLSLGYRGIYGDSTFGGGSHPFEVREIDPNQTFKDSTYYNNSANSYTGFSYYPLSMTPFNTTGPDLIDNPSDLLTSTITTSIRSKKRMNYPKDSIENGLRIKLKNTLGARFVNYDTTSTNVTKNAYYNDSAFNRLFKGLAIIPKAGTNSLMYYDLGAEKTKLIFYYRVKRAGGRIDTTATNFTHTAAAAHASSVVRTPSYSVSPGIPAQYVYLDGAPVSNYATLKIPSLASLSNRLLYLAELTVEEDPILGDAGATSNFYQPAVLFLDWFDFGTGTSNTFKTPKKDFALSSSNVSTYNLQNFGGYKKTKIDRNTSIEIAYYTFNLTRHIQDLISFGGTYKDFRLYAPRYTNPTVYFEASNSWVVADGLNNPLSFGVPGTGLAVNGRVAEGRVRLGGGAAQNTQHPMKLRLVYSKL